VKIFKIGTVADNPELSAAGHLQRFKNCNLYQFRTVAGDLICSSVSDDDQEEWEGRAAHGTCTKLVVPCMSERQTGDATPGSGGARREMEQGPTSLLFTASKPSAKQPPPSLLPNPPPTIPIRSLP
jgi:hypothetical protein